jgi:uncharacterized protein GlcG (DUF336 family)
MKARSVLTALLVALSLLTFARPADAQIRSRIALPPAADLTTPPDCAGAAPASACREGGTGSFSPLVAREVETIALNAARAAEDPRATVAVVDRAGRVLALYRGTEAPEANDDLAVGLARTAAFFSNDHAPLSSRTVRFISGVHFPPGVKRAPPAALYGIESTNRGCDLSVTFNSLKCIPRATSVRGGACNPFDQRGCGTGPVTGKADEFDGHRDSHPQGLDLASSRNPRGVPVNPGGVPIYRVTNFEIEGRLEDNNARLRVTGPSHLVGGVGVAGAAPEKAEAAAFTAVALAGGLLFPAPSFPLPEPGRVFIDGIRLPFVEDTTITETRFLIAPGTFVIPPRRGGCAANRYLVGPTGSAELSAAEVDRIVRRSVEVSQSIRGVIRLPTGRYARMVIAVSDLAGNILALYRMPDATVFSIDVAVAKARNVVYFSGDDAGVRVDLPGVPPGTAISNRTLSFGGQPLYPAGIDFSDPGPFFDLFVRDRLNACSQGSQQKNANQTGIVFFAGSLPLYRDGRLIGGFGVSGDGVEQDDYVSWFSVEEFQPPPAIQADQVKLRDARLSFVKFPRVPQKPTEEVRDSFEEP